MGIEWRQIEGYPHYFVSNTGLVKSCKRGFWHKLKLIENEGRYHVNLYDENGKTKKMSVSRIVAITFLENKFNKPNVDHIDRDVKNNSVDNLRWCTQSENLKNNNTVRYRSMFYKNRMAVLVAIENGISRETFYRRIRKGWSISDACTIKPKKYNFLRRTIKK